MKTVKSPYLRNRLTEFHEIWHGDGDTPLKFRIKKQDGGGRHIENHTNRDNTTKD